jgi:hypothetical protein
MAIRLGRYGESGESGWTEITPHASSEFYYVSSSHASKSDSNPGTDPDAPLATIAQAITNSGAATAGTAAPNWILLAEGDTFSGSQTLLSGISSKGGLSFQDPFVFTSYNPNKVGLTSTTPRGTQRAAPPLVSGTNTSASAGTWIQTSSATGHFAVIGIDFYCTNADYINNLGGYDSSKSKIDLSLAGPRRDGAILFIEDVHMLGGGSVSSFSRNLGVIVRRCSVQFTPGGNGFFGSACPYVQFEENSARHCAWIGGDQATAGNGDQSTRSTGGQLFYFDASKGNQERWILRGNFGYEGGGTGLRCRQGGEIYDNLLVDCATNGIEVCSASLSYAGTKESFCSGDFRIEDNVVLDGRTDNSSVGVTLAGLVNAAAPIGCSVNRNLITRCNQGIVGASHHTIGASGDINVCIGNDDDLAGTIEGTGSTITSTAGMSNSTYNLTDYATGYMGLADLDTFLDNKMAQRRYNFDERYMPWHINNVIRGFYNMSTTVDNRPSYYAHGAVSGRILLA